MRTHLAKFTITLSFVIAIAANPALSQQIRGFDTDFSQRSIDLSELIDGGPGKDGIPSIDNPKFASQDEASSWLNGVEPVISFEINGEPRAYPTQILMWHAILNHELGGVPVVIFHVDGIAPAMDNRATHRLRDDGANGVFYPDTEMVD